MHSRKLRAAFVAALPIIGLVAGCGGSGGDVVPRASATPSVSTGSVVTRATEGNYSRDTLVVAARVSDGILIRTDAADQIESDLKTIRLQYPVLADVHAREDFALNQILVEARSDAPYLNAWRSGTTTTGDASLDTTLANLRIASVELVSSDLNYYTLTFDAPLNAPQAASRVEGSSSSIAHSSANATIGDGDNITLSTSGANRVYAFSRGGGDCPAGCTSRHFWTVTITPSGSLSLVESGDDLSTVSNGGHTVSAPQ